MRISVADAQSYADLAISLLTIIGLVVAARFVYWQSKLYRRLIANTRAIRKERADIAENYQPFSVASVPTAMYLSSEVTDKIDTHYAKHSDGPVPLSKLEQLQEARRFILDELLFVKK